MSKLFDALRALSPEDEEEYIRLRRAVPQSESALNAATQGQAREATPGLFAGLQRGFTGEASPTRPTLPYALGTIPGSIVRSKLGLNITEPDRIAEAIAVEEAKMDRAKNAEAINRADVEANYPMLKPVGAEGGQIKYAEEVPDVNKVKLEIEQAEKEKQLKEKSDLIKQNASNTLETLKEVEKGIKYFGMRGQLPSFPGTSRVNWEANVNKLLAGKVLDVMREMKEASKTGATGFGQLSNKELGVLQSAATALKKSLKPEDAQKYLNQMKQALYKVVSGLEIGAEEDGYIYKGGDPGDSKNWEKK